MAANCSAAAHCPAAVAPCDPARQPCDPVPPVDAVKNQIGYYHSTYHTIDAHTNSIIETVTYTQTDRQSHVCVSSHSNAANHTH